MEFNQKSITVSIGGRDITFETGKIARQAGGAVLVRSGDTVLLGTACSAPPPSEDTDFLPLRVDYQEKFSSAGKTLGGFIKREGRPTEKEILTCRLIDRPIRPMFPEGFYNEVQILAYVYSYDGVHSPDPLAISQHPQPLSFPTSHCLNRSQAFASVLSMEISSSIPLLMNKNAPVWT